LWKQRSLVESIPGQDDVIRIVPQLRWNDGALDMVLLKDPRGDLKAGQIKC
jgi:hypothetical protein